ncbi:MAG TPA: hypothetical protein VIH82_05350 [Acidimicrobiia bacterium]
MALSVLVMAMLLVGAGVAAAQTTGDTSYPTVSTTPRTDPCTSSSVCGTSATVPQVGGVSASRSLPFSGGDVALLTLLGLAAVGGGAAIVLLSRRRRSTSAA